LKGTFSAWGELYTFKTSMVRGTTCDNNKPNVPPPGATHVSKRPVICRLKPVEPLLLLLLLLSTSSVTTSHVPLTRARGRHGRGQVPEKVHVAVNVSTVLAAPASSATFSSSFLANGFGQPLSSPSASSASARSANVQPVTANVASSKKEPKPRTRSSITAAPPTDSESPSQRQPDERSCRNMLGALSLVADDAGSSPAPASGTRP